MLNFATAFRKLSHFSLILLSSNYFLAAQDLIQIKPLKQICLETILKYEIDIEPLAEHIKNDIEDSSLELYTKERERVMRALEENNILPSVDIIHGIKTLHILKSKDQACCSTIFQTGLKKYNIEFTGFRNIFACALSSCSVASFTAGWTFGCCLFTNPQTCCAGLTVVAGGTVCSGFLLVPLTIELQSTLQKKYYEYLLPELTQENVSGMPPQTIVMDNMDPFLLLENIDTPTKEHSDSDEEISDNGDNEENWLLQD